MPNKNNSLIDFKIKKEKSTDGDANVRSSEGGKNIWSLEKCATWVSFFLWGKHIGEEGPCIRQLHPAAPCTRSFLRTAAAGGKEATFIKWFSERSRIGYNIHTHTHTHTGVNQLVSLSLSLKRTLTQVFLQLFWRRSSGPVVNTKPPTYFLLLHQNNRGCPGAWTLPHHTTVQHVL